MGLLPGAGAAAMATAVVSVALLLAGRSALAVVWLGLAAVVWLALVAAAAAQLSRDRARWRAYSATPPALTAVAATAVLGTRLSVGGWRWTAWVLLAVAAWAWLVLLPRVVRHWRTPTVGASFLVCVATQGLVVLACTLALVGEASWLCAPSLCLFVLGLVGYVIVLARFDLGQLRSGGGDQWVAGGALAISALACSRLVAVTSPQGPLRWLTGLHGALALVDLIVLGLALAWYAVLVTTELRWPRLRYDHRRWSTVFPLGMTATATIAAASVTDLTWLRLPGELLVWPALLVWLLVAAGSGRRMLPARRQSAAGGA
ncbi:MAG: hypothetical protein GEV09_10860 [Pseudonocardiaceae bacterium]|nr:hypothetical protein [Pseudonocardiaceae bacterium]